MSDSPRGSPQFPTGGQELPFVQGYDPHGRLHDGDELLELHPLKSPPKRGGSLTRAARL